MVLRKLFKTKDNYRIIEFLDCAKNIEKKVNKYNSNNVVMTIEDVKDIIDDIKSLYSLSLEVEKNILNANIKDKDKDIKIKLLTDKFEYVKILYDKMKEYETQLKNYDNLGNDLK